MRAHYTMVPDNVEAEVDTTFMQFGMPSIRLKFSEGDGVFDETVFEVILSSTTLNCHADLFKAFTDAEAAQTEYLRRHSE